VEYKTFYLDATKETKSVAGSLQIEAPTEMVSASYQSDSWEDDGSFFTLTFKEPTELIGSSLVSSLHLCGSRIEPFTNRDIFKAQSIHFM
jgi:hypothetical protein